MAVILASAIATEVIVVVGDHLAQRSFSRLIASKGPFATNSVLMAPARIVAAVVATAIIRASFEEDSCLLSCLSIHMDGF